MQHQTITTLLTLLSQGFTITLTPSTTGAGAKITGSTTHFLVADTKGTEQQTLEEAVKNIFELSPVWLPGLEVSE